MAPTRLPYTLYDAFTSRPFGGNPATVILLEAEHGLTDETMQLIGKEFNLSETAFLVPLADHTPAAPHFSLRWFTPKIEAPLCGHATLAAAAHLHDHHPELTPPYRFASRFSGELRVGYDAPSGLYSLDFPVDVPVPLADAAAGRAIALRCFPELREGDVKAVAMTKRGYLVEVAESVDVASVKHDSVAIARDVPVGQCVLTGPHTPTPADPSQVHSRMFASGSGIDEDPVTGSAHTRIVPYWLEKIGGTELKCRQVSARGGELDCVWLKEEGRVVLRGHGVKMAEGVLFV